jgi:uncharacterized protein
MTTKIIEIKKPKLKDPIFISGLPGIGNVGRIAAGYLVEELKAEKFAELYSSHFMPFVLLQQDNTIRILKIEFFYHKAKSKNQRDLIILIGDSQSIDPEGHYEIVNEILSYVKKFGVKEIITLAGLSVGEMTQEPKVVGAASSEYMIKKYKNCGVDFKSTNKIGTIVGASGLFIGLGKYYNMEGICLLGETIGFPIIPDPKSAGSVLKVLEKILKIKIDLSRLDKKVKEMEDFIKKVEDVQKKAIMEMIKSQAPAPEKDKERLSYIG